MRNRVGQTAQRYNTLTTRFLKSETQSTAQRFLYVPLPDFGCLPAVFAALHGFKLLQPVAVRRPVEQLLQSVPNMFRTVATKSISQFLSRNPSARAYRLRAQFDDGTEPRFAIQKENKI